MTRQKERALNERLRTGRTTIEDLQELQRLSQSARAQAAFEDTGFHPQATYGVSHNTRSRPTSRPRVKR